MISKILIVSLAVLLGVSFFANFYTYSQLAIKDTEKAQIIASKDKERLQAIKTQREQKNEIADIYDKQASLNDDLVGSQKNLNRTSKDYIALIDKSIRFVDGQPQILPGAVEKNLLDAKSKLLQAIVDIDKISQENTQIKEKNSDRVKQIYITAGEDRNNTTNDREGIR